MAQAVQMIDADDRDLRPQFSLGSGQSADVCFHSAGSRGIELPKMADAHLVFPTRLARGLPVFRGPVQPASHENVNSSRLLHRRAPENRTGSQSSRRLSPFSDLHRAVRADNLR